MDIGDWKATTELNDLYRELRELGIEHNVAELETFGFTVVEDAAPLDFIDALRKRILEVAARRSGLDTIPDDGSSHQGRTQFMHDMLSEGPLFEQAVMNPKARGLLRYLLGESYVLNGLHAFVKGPDAPAGNLHTDQPSPSPLPRYAQVANCNWLLTDYTAEGGAIRFLPGSHRWCRQPTEAEKDTDFSDLMVPIEAPRGSLAVFHGNTWHGVCPKLTPGVRVNLIYYACRPYIRPQEFYLDRLPQEVFDRNPDSFRRLLGGDLPFTDTTYGGRTGSDDDDTNKRQARFRASLTAQHL